jgi:hypothetical protein
LEAFPLEAFRSYYPLEAFPLEAFPLEAYFPEDDVQDHLDHQDQPEDDVQDHLDHLEDHHEPEPRMQVE